MNLYNFYRYYKVFKDKINENDLFESKHIMLQKWIDDHFDKRKVSHSVGDEHISILTYIWKENKSITFSESMTGLLKFFCQHGIDKFNKLESSDNVASIGFSEIEQKWYGWSHRAIYGFGIGTKIKKGDCAYVDHAYTCRTLEQCKKAAMDFAEDVS